MTVIQHPRGFDRGYTEIISQNKSSNLHLDFGILRLLAHEHFDLGSSCEHALVLLTGDATISFAKTNVKICRHSLFDEQPKTLHMAGHKGALIRCHEDSEFALIRTENDNNFASVIFDENNMAKKEHRGRGILDDTAYRFVRTIFDKRNRPASNLVVGEVVTLPGRWSSWPPHFHAQPEIYHYRFTKPEGYGHAELGEQVFKIKQFDTLLIENNNTHAQVSAPGYGMYYLWAIRHLPDDPYVMPTFVDEHAWTKEASANDIVWKP